MEESGDRGIRTSPYLIRGILPAISERSFGKSDDEAIGLYAPASLSCVATKFRMVQVWRERKCIWVAIRAKREGIRIIFFYEYESIFRHLNKNSEYIYGSRVNDNKVRSCPCVYEVVLGSVAR